MLTNICCSRSLPGPPLTQDSTLSLLIANNVTVGLGVEEPWEAKNARFDLAWVRVSPFLLFCLHHVHVF